MTTTTTTTKAPAKARTAPAKAAPAKSAPAKAAPKPAGNSCRCGCGATVKRVFAQGHDARWCSLLRREVAEGRMTPEAAQAQADAVSEGLSRKMAKSLAAVVAEQLAQTDKLAVKSEKAQAAK